MRRRRGITPGRRGSRVFRTTALVGGAEGPAGGVGGLATRASSITTRVAKEARRPPGEGGASKARRTAGRRVIGHKDGTFIRPVITAIVCGSAA